MRRHKRCEFGHRIVGQGPGRRCPVCRKLYQRLYREDRRRENGVMPFRYKDVGTCRYGHNIEGNHYVVRATDRKSGLKRICAFCVSIKNQKRRVKCAVEYIDPLVLYKRDKGICGICKRPVHVNQFHIDHVIPLSKGGEHSYRNTQITHPACNLKKRASLPLKVKSKSNEHAS